MSDCKNFVIVNFSNSEVSCLFFKAKDEGLEAVNGGALPLNTAEI